MATSAISTVTNTVKNVGNWVNQNKKTIAKVAVATLAVAALVGITVLSGGAALAVAGSYLATATVYTAGFIAGGIVTKYAGSMIQNIDKTNTLKEASRLAAQETKQALPEIAITAVAAGLLAPLAAPMVQGALPTLGLAATKFTASAFEGYVDDAVNVADDLVDDASGAYAGTQANGATQSGNAGTTACTDFASNTVSNSTEVKNLLDNMPELTGSTREKLLSTVQSPALRGIVDELYRPGATVGDGGTASKLVQEFLEGSSTHLLKAQQRLSQLNRLASSGTLGLNDLDILEALRNDLVNAINLFN